MKPLLTQPMLEMFSAWLAPVRDQISPDISLADHAKLTQAITQEALRRFGDFLAGIKYYQNATVERDVDAAIIPLWEKGTTRLLDYAPQSSASVVLVVPSLVNRLEILDLEPDHSFLKFLAAQGFHPLVIDWSEPGEEEKLFDISDYVTKRLMPILEVAERIANSAPCHLLGYCMGGTLALALAHIAPKSISSLSLMAAPWDFQAKGVGGVPAVGTLVGNFFLDQAKRCLPCLDSVGAVPSSFLQVVFTGFQPLHVLQKFSRFAQPPSDENIARRFVLTEDWLNNGIPLALPVAKDCLEKWYEKNETMKLEWSVAGSLIDPREISVPTYIVVPSNDKVVPPECAKPLAAQIKGAVLHEPNTGHLGLMASQYAPELVWTPFVQWLHAQEEK